MPHFTLQISQQGPVLNAVIGVSFARQSALTEAHQAIPNPVPIRALVDTGASVTCVDPSVLQALNLTPTGSTPLVTPTTGPQPVEVDQYDVSLIIPGAASSQIPLFRHTLPVVCAELLSAQGFHALVGRDVLAECMFFYNGSTGLFSLAF